MEDRQDDGVPGGFDGLALADGRLHVLRDGLGDGEEHDAGADPGGEEHGGPGEGGEVRGGVVRTEPHAPVLAQGDQEDERERGRDEKDVEGAEPLPGPVDGRLEGALHNRGRDEGAGGDNRDDDGGGEEHPPVDGLLVGFGRGRLAGRIGFGGAVGLRGRRDGVGGRGSGGFDG